VLLYANSLKFRARTFRSNMTKAEELLWSRVRNKQLDNYPFYRQKVIGGYIVDFYCPKGKLVVELDGNQHDNPEQKENDKVRDLFMLSQGLKTLRFRNQEVLNNINNVTKLIQQNMHK
jgi:very-short-patch-repair endonuclease